MSALDESPSTPHETLIDVLFSTPPVSTHADLSKRVQLSAEAVTWQSSRIEGLSLCVLEHHLGPHPRLTALAKVDPNCGGISIPAEELEILVQHGIVAVDDTEFVHPHYLRQPRNNAHDNTQFTLHAGSQNKIENAVGLEFYIATGQLAHTDTERRCINLTDHNLWLPGPVEHTQVMPLHMHKGNNSMLVRWLENGSFRPKLDPLGEEVLVIHGQLSDELGTYAQGSWIRNPLSSWQSWAGAAGTVIYYKNGHFESAASQSNAGS